MNHDEASFEGVQGLKIYYQTWIPPNPKAIIQFLHGVTEHSGRFPYLMEALYSNGYAIYANDHRGHRKSEGERVHVDSLDDYVGDAKRFNDLIRARHPSLPIFMVGYSLGGIIACEFLKKYESLLKGAVLVGIVSSIQIPLKYLVLLKLFSRLKPRRRFGPLLDATLLAKNPELVTSNLNDPLVAHQQMTLRMVREILKGYSLTIQRAKEFQLPLLVQCGSEDKLIERFRASCPPDKLHAMFTMADKTIKIYDGLYHEVYNESKEQRDEVLGDLVEWLNTPEFLERGYTIDIESSAR